MYSLITGCLKWVNAKEEVQVLMVGLPQSGKTTLIEQVKRAHVPGYGGPRLEALTATYGMNLARLDLKDVHVTCWDLGGSVSVCAGDVGLHPVCALPLVLFRLPPHATPPSQLPTPSCPSCPRFKS